MGGIEASFADLVNCTDDFVEAIDFLEPLSKKARFSATLGDGALCDFLAEFVAVVGDVGYQELGSVAAEAEDLAY